MQIKKFSLWSAVAALGLVASLACENRAHAQVTYGNDLELGGNYNTFAWSLNTGTFSAASEGGGSINTSYLNGVQLPWVYCVDIPDNVSVPADYDNTRVSTDGTAEFGANNPWVGTPGLTLVGGSATIVGEITYLLDTYATNAIGNVTSEEELQAAIWQVIYGSDFTVQRLKRDELC